MINEKWKLEKQKTIKSRCSIDPAAEASLGLDDISMLEKSSSTCWVTGRGTKCTEVVNGHSQQAEAARGGI